ncbi:hypothetical protein [Pedobacter alpinus]|uniref:Outer membrane protein beta-barrel domain-containing protein n=1 Tax=Pedobacter alpinus TaxID=1590643 RepID=A0ABW5TMF0_9SPHI
MKKFNLIAFIFMVSAFVAKAQDKIYKTNGQVLETKVLEISTIEIKYKVFANLNGPTYTIPKTEALKVVYENGTTETFTDSETKVAVEAKRAQNIFVELGGQGLVFTANYDTRFSNKRNGIGGRIGIGAIGGDGANVMTIPVSLNYLLGEGKNFFEIGLGATYANASIFDSNGSAVFGTMSFMYRLQPVKSGFSFRGGFTPFFNSDVFIPYYVGISLGYTF